MALADARRVVLDAVRVLPAEHLPLRAALGCVSADAVIASSDIPPFANSAMDGYAIHSSDTVSVPSRLRVVAEVMAGHVPGVPVRTGEALRIMTGAPMPEDADAVVPVECTAVEADRRTVTVLAHVEAGTNVRHPGDDIAVGCEVFPAATVLRASRVGVLASLGVTHLSVHRTPRVGVLSTGDELADRPGPLPAGKIRDANRPALLGLVDEAGFDAVDLGVAGDDEHAITALISEGASGCDALVTSGGVSVGDVDYVKIVLDTLSGGTMRWMQVAIKPAKPFAFGVVDDGRVPVFGLAGNPVSAIVGFELFARPALRSMAGHRHIDRPILRATAAVDLPRTRDGKLHLMRVVARQDDAGVLSVVPVRGQASHMLLAMAEANALALVPDGDGVRAGQRLDVMMLDCADTGRPDRSLDEVLRGLP